MLVLLAILHPDNLATWGRYAQAVAHGSLCVIVFGSVLINRPFTEGHARDHAPREIWASPAFRAFNWKISAVWGLASWSARSSMLLAGPTDWPIVGRCQLHKLRNVQAKLPQHLAATVATKMRAAYRMDSALAAQADLESLARQLQKTHPGAAGSLREGLEETLTVMRLGVPPTLARTLRSTDERIKRSAA